MKPLVLVLAGIPLALARVARRSPRSLRIGPSRLLALACRSTTLVWGFACSATDEDATQPAVPPAEVPPADQTPAEAPATSPGRPTAEDVADGFLEAFGAFDAEE